MPKRINNLEQEGKYILDLADHSSSQEFLNLASKIGNSENKNDLIEGIMKVISNPIDKAVNKSNHPNVQTLSYDWGEFYNDFGLKTGVQADLSFGYKLPIFSVKTDRQQLVVNPQVFIEAASHNYLAFHFGILRFRFNIDLLAFKFTAFDAQLMMSLESSERGIIDFCAGL